MEEEALEAVRGGLGGAARARRPWDDDFVLKRQFSALIPAFDPRPGRTNLNQTVGEYRSIPGNIFCWFELNLVSYQLRHVIS